MPPLGSDLKSVDVAALETLRLVHELGSFTAASERLDVNQSAVSYTIAKLRACFGDPLFVREAGRQVPTERCERLLEHAGTILDLLDEMSEPDTFDPARTEATVTLACNFYERILIIPRIVSTLRAEAPLLSIRVINALGDGHLRLLRREADVLIGPFERPESGFHSKRLHQEKYACLMDPSHPQAGRKLDAGTYLSLNHILIHYGAGWKSAYLQELEAAGHVLRPTMTVPSPAGIAAVIAGSDLVATVPSRLGQSISEGLTISDCPFRGGFDISVVWTARNNNSAMHRWLREQIFTACL